MNRKREEKGIAKVPANMLTRKEEENLRMYFVNTIFGVTEQEISVAYQRRFSLEERNHA
jgi:hypothetical protein